MYNTHHNINTKCPIKNMLLWQENKLRVCIYKVSICDMKSQLHHCTSDIHKNEYLYFVVRLQWWENSMFFFDKSFLWISVSCLESCWCLIVLHALFKISTFLWSKYVSWYHVIINNKINIHFHFHWLDIIGIYIL